MVKPVFILIISLLAISAADAQNVANTSRDTVACYLTKFNKRVFTKDSADYLMVILPPDTSTDKDLFRVKEYYPNGRIRFISGSRTNELKSAFPGFYEPILQGPYLSFFSNGHKMKVGSYEKGNPAGDETAYYPNGKLYNTKTYTKDKKLLCNECRDSTGTILTAGGNGKWLTFIEEDFRICIEGKVVNGLEEGEWHGKHDDTVNIVWEYKNGTLLSSKEFNLAGKEIHTKIFSSVDIVPEFPGGLEAFYQFLMRNIHYPAAARENNTQGRVIVSFVVEADGTLTDVTIARGIGDGCDEEALRVIKLSPPWKPGTQNGRPVRVRYSVPIAFTLSR